MNVTIAPTQETVVAGGQVTLVASLDSPETGVTWSWEEKKPGESVWAEAGGDKKTLTRVVPDAGTWMYKVTATKDGVASTSPELPVTVTAAGAVVAAPDKVKLEFPTPFGPAFGILLLVLLVIFVWRGDLFNLGVGVGEEALKSDPRAALAAKVIGPTLALSVLLLLTGVWMVCVEWRAGFRTKEAPSATTAKSGLDLGDILKSVANLKGSSLVFVGGLAVLFCMAWMVSATAGNPADTPTSPPASTAPSTAPSTNPSPTAPASPPGATPTPQISR